MNKIIVFNGKIKNPDLEWSPNMNPAVSHLEDFDQCSSFHALGQRELVLKQNDLIQINRKISELCLKFNSVESPEFLEACEFAASDLPSELLQTLISMSTRFLRNGYLVIRGFPLDDAAIGNTPDHWDVPWANTKVFREEVFQCLISSAVGSAFGWRTQENGRCLRHIVPIEQDKMEQLGGSSATTLLWHTEEAFHEARADFFTLMCYRNSERATTNIACLDDLELDSETFEILSQERFIIEPDKSHLPDNNKSNNWSMSEECFDRISDMINFPKPQSVFYGRQGSKKMRVDQAFMRPIEGDLEAESALDKLHDELDRQAHNLVLNAGDIVLLDNMLVAHGRSTFKPNPGNKKRWMRRVNIGLDKKSRAAFADPRNSHIML